MVRGYDQRWNLLSHSFLLLWMVAVTLCLAERTGAQETGVLRGTVTDREFATPLSAVTVWIAETKDKTVSDDTGHFALHGLAAGTYTVVLSKSGFDRVVRSNVVVAPSAMTTLDVAMPAQYEEMEALVVRPLEAEGQAQDDDGMGQDLAQLGTKLADDLAARVPVDAVDLELINLRAGSVGVVDAVSKDFMGKAGAGSAAEAVKLVAGVTLAEDKFAVIRGLSDRFVNTTVNGIAVPTADPDVRAVQLDLFPSALLESIRVYKTFTPDLPGNTSGGSVDIVTPSMPDRLVLEVKAGVAYNTQATGNKNFLTSGQGMGYFGLDEGERKQTVQNGDIPTARRYPRTPPAPAYDPANPSPEWQQWIANAKKLESQTRSLSSVMGPTREAADPNHNWGVTYGDRIKLGVDTSVGWLLAGSYSSKYTYHENGVERNLVSSDLLTFGPAIGSSETAPTPSNPVGNVDPDQWQTEEGRHTVGTGLGSVFELKSGDHSVRLNYLRTQQTEDKALSYVDKQTNPLRYWRNESLIYTARSMDSLQLLGTTPLEFLDIPPLRLGLDPDVPRLEWAAATSSSAQDQPDRRFFVAEYNPALQQWNAPEGINDFAQRSWRTITEDSKFYRADLIWPYAVGNDRQGQLKTGWSFEDTYRTYTQDTLIYKAATYVSPSTPYTTNPGSFDDPWSQVFLERQRLGYPFLGTGADYSSATPWEANWVIEGFGRDIDYTGVQQIPAYYGTTEVPVFPWLKLIGGARLEKTTLSTEVHAANGRDDQVYVLDVRKYIERHRNPNDNSGIPITSPGSSNPPVTLAELANASIEQTDVLPSLGLALDLVGNLKLRGTWSQTVARPTFKELTPVSQQDHLGGQMFAGNPTLTMSQVENYDLRLEWNPGDGRLLSVSGFAKTITEPIDYSIRPTAFGSDTVIMPFNYPEGEVRGLEFEARQDLGRLHPWLRGLTLGGSYTWLEATVTLPDNEATQMRDRIINLKRQHAGLSPSDPTPAALTDSVDVGKRRMKDQPAYLISLYALYEVQRSGTSFALFLNRSGETLVAGEDFSSEFYIPNRVAKPSTSLDFSVSQKVCKHGKLSLSITNLLNPEIVEVWQSDYVDQGEAIASSYTKGRTISLSFSLKW